jgi:hypothetical protein
MGPSYIRRSYRVYGSCNEDTFCFSIIAGDKVFFLFLDSDVKLKRAEWKGMDSSA